MVAYAVSWLFRSAPVSGSSVDTIHQRNAIHCRLPVGMPQPDRSVVQDAASCSRADRLHLVNK